MRIRATYFLFAVILLCCSAAAQPGLAPARERRGIPQFPDLIVNVFPRSLIAPSRANAIPHGLNISIPPIRKSSASPDGLDVIDTAIAHGSHITPQYYRSLDTTRHLFSFNANARRTSDLTQKLSNNLWFDSLRETNTYDSNNRMLSDLIQHQSAGQWVDSLRYTYTYDANGWPASLLTETWSADQWVNSDRFLLTASANGQDTALVWQIWENGQWVNVFRVTGTFDTGGRPIISLTQGWSNGEWVNGERYTYTYDAYGNEISQLYEEWSNGQWVNSQRHTYTYDGQGTMLSDVYELWSNDQWVNQSRYAYTYDAQGDRLSDVLALYSNGQWADTLRSFYTYDEKGHKTAALSQYWSGSWWDNDRYEYFYDTKGNPVSFWHYGWAGEGLWLPIAASDPILLNDNAGNFYDFQAGWYDVELSYRTFTEIASDEKLVPATCSLSQNYPNPFNPATTISYELPRASAVRLSVYDLLGREVEVLANERQEAGVYRVRFDASRLSSGVYLYQLRTAEQTQTRRMLLLR